MANNQESRGTSGTQQSGSGQQGNRGNQPGTGQQMDNQTSQQQHSGSGMPGNRPDDKFKNQPGQNNDRGVLKPIVVKRKCGPKCGYPHERFSIGTGLSQVDWDQSETICRCAADAAPENEFEKGRHRDHGSLRGRIWI